MDKSTEIATLALVEARVNNDKKSFGLAYLFLGSSVNRVGKSKGECGLNAHGD